ncbi:hypothetical protein J3Q64DRAFT_1841625 [Phycomyces blakesleeanus]|uniref:FYVE-type domain-containing protein n=2 Tax=Phycomyces blakesleeanus TaxID=4837 RepID=A0ABR3AL18_PHYBL
MPSSDPASLENSRFLHALESKKRRESVGEVMARRRSSAIAIVPRLTRSSHAIDRRGKQTPLMMMTRQETNQQDSMYSAAHTLWDPRIDAFEVLRATITGITRNMQAFHVKEIFDTETAERRTQDDPFEQVRRLSSASSRFVSYSDETSHGSAALADCGYHRRIRSQGSVTIDTQRPPLEGDVYAPWLHYHQPKESSPHSIPASPSLTSLFLTTNTLINSRLDELSETASIASSASHDTDLLAVEWRTRFLELLTSCITQSEELETFSTELLNAEGRVRELMAINDTVEEQFEKREKAYADRITECEEVAKQQLHMIESLAELMADLDMQINLQNQDEDESPDEDDEMTRWDFRKTIADLLHLEEKNDMIHKMRWDVGMCVGGGVGTGHVIHTFEGRLRGIEMMIAGSGVVEDTEKMPTKATKDRKERFVLLPRKQWTPDTTTDQCQFQSGSLKVQCNTQFSFFQRKHHCRKCGMIVCQRHSANQLPLFSYDSPCVEWSRVCDACFYSLIIRTK